MRIKHFTGYGVVDATKLSTKTFTDIYGDKRTEMVIRVKGNHEWGLCRDDAYDAFNWLLKKHFAKNLTDYRCLEDFSVRTSYEELPKEEQTCYYKYREVCDYRFVY